jgi:hypothetical protein
VIVVKKIQIPVETQENKQENKQVKPAEEDVEKPLARFELEVSEDYHGGREQTKSMPNPNLSSDNSTNREGNKNEDIDIETTVSSNGYSSDEDEDEDYDEYDEEDYGDDDYDDDYDDDDEHQFNSSEVVKIDGKYRKESAARMLANAIYRLIEYLSDETKNPSTIPSPSSVLNIKRLLLRPYERKPLSSYYYYRERSSVIIILDNSGSMNWLEDELNSFFNAALMRKDIELYIAPNGKIEEKYDLTKKEFYSISHERGMQLIVVSGLPVIYFGDFDGADTPVELSWTNRVFWVCPETRYKYFREHDWVHYDEYDFKGFFGRAFDADEIAEVLTLFSKNITRAKFWHDPHSPDEFKDDEEY